MFCQQVFPYVSPLVEHMRHGASAVELRECLVLINQLMASFKEQLAPFMAQQLPAICSQIAVALTPFAAPGGGVNGVCGLYLDGAHRVNPAFGGGNQGQGGGVSGGTSTSTSTRLRSRRVVTPRRRGRRGIWKSSSSLTRTVSSIFMSVVLWGIGLTSCFVHRRRG